MLGKGLAERRCPRSAEAVDGVNSLSRVGEEGFGGFGEEWHEDIVGWIGRGFEFEGKRTVTADHHSRPFTAFLRR